MAASDVNEMEATEMMVDTLAAAKWEVKYKALRHEMATEYIKNALEYAIEWNYYWDGAGIAVELWNVYHTYSTPLPDWLFVALVSCAECRCVSDPTDPWYCPEQLLHKYYVRPKDLIRCTIYTPKEDT